MSQRRSRARDRLPSARDAGRARNRLARDVRRDLRGAVGLCPDEHGPTGAGILDRLLRRSRLRRLGPDGDRVRPRGSGQDRGGALRHGRGHRLPRQIGYTGLIFILIHVALSADWSQAKPFTPSDTPALVWFGGIATAALVVLVATSVWRRQPRLSYEVWQVLHAVLAVVAVVAALAHVLLVDYYVDSVWKQVLWAIMAAAFLWLLVWVRVLRPLRIRRRPWTVDRVTPDSDSTTVLTLSPTGHDGLRFEPGQFAWITVGRSPFSVTSHPFSFCSSAESNGSVEVAIKAAGDFTSSVANVEPGTEVYVDGPHGVFSIDQYEGAGFCLIAGGWGSRPP
ncbi:MAG: ferric reductase-like transmembrane domain-containing protein [Nocardioides sp.]|nr:ferric reductase-like transmembrane domain-containing protein [Nocardioides sp.]